MLLAKKTDIPAVFKINGKGGAAAGRPTPGLGAGQGACVWPEGTKGWVVTSDAVRTLAFTPSLLLPSPARQVAVDRSLLGWSSSPR